VKGTQNNLLNVENYGLHLYVSNPSIFIYVKKHLLMKIFTFAGGFGVKFRRIYLKTTVITGLNY